VDELSRDERHAHDSVPQSGRPSGSEWSASLASVQGAEIASLALQPQPHRASAPVGFTIHATVAGWQLRLRVPDYSPLFARSPDLADAVRDSRIVITGSRGPPRPRGLAGALSHRSSQISGKVAVSSTSMGRMAAVSVAFDLHTRPDKSAPLRASIEEGRGRQEHLGTDRLVSNLAKPGRQLAFRRKVRTIAESLLEGDAVERFNGHPTPARTRRHNP
jgi:hypothetical protein